MKLVEVTSSTSIYERMLKKAATELGFEGGQHKLMLDNGNMARVFNRRFAEEHDFIVFTCVWEPNKFLVWVGLPNKDEALLRVRIGDQLFTAETYEQLLAGLGKATQAAVDKARKVLARRHIYAKKDTKEIEERAGTLFRLFDKVYTMVREQGDEVKAFSFNRIHATITSMKMDEDEAEVLRALVKPHALKLLQTDVCVGGLGLQVRPDAIDPKDGYTLSITWSLKQKWGNPRAINRSKEDVIGTAVWNRFMELVDA